MDQFANIVENSPWLLLTFAFLFGAIIGSFLNVVVYRLPLGMNLMHPPSRCPNCSHAIRWYDNVPILGWILLRGRCRHCKAPISARYPAIEFLLGLVFLTFCWIDVVTPAHALIEFAKSTAPADQPIDLPTQAFAAQWIYHLLLLCTLLAAALIDSDGHRLPPRLITLPAAVGILLAFALPTVQALSVTFGDHSASSLASLWALATSLVGMVAAVGLRLGMLNYLGPARLHELGLGNAALATYAVGAFLGWQAVWVIGLVVGIWAFSTQTPRWRSSLGRLQPTAVVFAASLVWCALAGQVVAWLHSR